MKQQILRVSEMPIARMNDDMLEYHKAPYELPDGTRIEIGGKDMFMMTEPMFDQTSYSNDGDAEMIDACGPFSKTIPNMIQEAITNSDLDI